METELRINPRDGKVYWHDVWHASSELREFFKGDYAAMNAVLRAGRELELEHFRTAVSQSATAFPTEETQERARPQVPPPQSARTPAGPINSKPDAAREAEGQKLIAWIEEWKSSAELRRRCPTFGDLLLERGWSPDGGFASGAPIQVARETLEDRARRTWQSSLAIRKEFGCLETYAAFLRHEHHTTIVGGRVVSLSDEDIGAIRAEARTSR